MFKNLNSLHHAYLLVGESLAAESYLHHFFGNEGVKLVGSPDFFLWRVPVFGIEEARALNLANLRKAFGERKIFFIVAERLTLQAQNALLKTFEDPHPHTHFFLTVREKELVIPTLRSRMETLSVLGAGLPAKEAEQFLALTLTKRLDFARKFADQEWDLSTFLDHLLIILRRQNLGEKVAKVYKQRLVSDQPSASSRLILEHLSLML